MYPNLKNNIFFLNEPKFSEHEADHKFNVRRKKLIPEIENLLHSHALFVGKNMTITFIHSGVASLVSIIDTHAEKYILKIPLSILDARLEGLFLKRWESLGVTVPHIFEEGNIGDFFYILMEYIETQTLGEKYEQSVLLEKGMYRDLGKLLNKMHAIKIKGYTNIVNSENKPIYPTISQWLKNDIRAKEQIMYTKDHSLLNDEHGSIKDVYTVLISQINEHSHSVYCHNDFHIRNVFATEPLTVFDPWPCFHHPYMDLARSIIISGDVSRTSEQLIEGYFGKELFDRKLLHAFIIFNAYLKFPYMHKTKRVNEMEKLKEYLLQTKHHLYT
jgi:RIO-like serine/threonine protein kinase